MPTALASLQLLQAWDPTSSLQLLQAWDPTSIYISPSFSLSICSTLSHTLDLTTPRIHICLSPLPADHLTPTRSASHTLYCLPLYLYFLVASTIICPYPRPTGFSTASTDQFLVLLKATSFMMLEHLPTFFSHPVGATLLLPPPFMFFRNVFSEMFFKSLLLPATKYLRQIWKITQPVFRLIIYFPNCRSLFLIWYVMMHISWVTFLYGQPLVIWISLMHGGADLVIWRADNPNVILHWETLFLLNNKSNASNLYSYFFFFLFSWLFNMLSWFAKEQSCYWNCMQILSTENVRNRIVFWVTSAKSNIWQNFLN
jgi:hypothetical protein